ncbi:6-phosphogluconolactonase [Sphingobacterium phlebotomi]|uniref:6-phosphogluconolactonase n=1 Tax=Sphingobacterium phlebotomi TaxID=2605433 RepID=A0A5D4HAW8_9SPHI|nr:6-phosphogluconolactonase [Sphingobacterium phlebotomi]TYR36645.1 6-phosphogluconolactonase [Sphingobacterium phlebotomi]
MIKQFKNKAEIFATAAQLFVDEAKKNIDEKGFFSVALTGGSSPIDLHKLLATDTYKSQVDWSKIFVFWGDERWVPLDDNLSNAKMSYETLLNHVPIPKSNIFPMYKKGVDAEDYAQTYEQILREKLGDNARLDFIFLGMGDDGHTASLFPGTKVLHERDKWVDAYFLVPQNMYRITLTAPFINRAEKIVVIAFGEKKAKALREVLQGDKNPELYPSQLLKPITGELLFLVDDEAATMLT